MGLKCGESNVFMLNAKRGTLKAEGRRQKAKGRRQRTEGKGQKANTASAFWMFTIYLKREHSGAGLKP
jgi:hypothetical protein